MVEAAEDYPWSSAAAHASGIDSTGLLDMAWWQNEGPKNWSATRRRSKRTLSRNCGSARMRDGHSEAWTLYEKSVRKSGEPGFVVDLRRNNRSRFPQRRQQVSSVFFEKRNGADQAVPPFPPSADSVSKNKMSVTTLHKKLIQDCL